MPTDEEIEARLKSLKDFVFKLNPQQEIEERLARLTGRDPSYYSSNNRPIHLILPHDRNLTDEQKSDKLLHNIMQELTIDQEREVEMNDFQEDIRERLNKIQQFTNQLPPSKSSTKKRIVIDEPEPISNDDSGNSDDDMENWCTTCNEDATVICPDCEGDKYCLECFRELHRDPDLRDHKKKPLHKKK